MRQAVGAFCAPLPTPASAENIAHMLRAMFALCKYTDECNIIALVLLVRFLSYQVSAHGTAACSLRPCRFIAASWLEQNRIARQDSKQQIKEVALYR